MPGNFLYIESFVNGYCFSTELLPNEKVISNYVRSTNICYRPIDHTYATLIKRPVFRNLYIVSPLKAVRRLHMVKEKAVRRYGVRR